MELASTEVSNVSDELDLQTEKYIELQRKLGIQRESLYKNRSSLQKLKDSINMKNIVKLLIGIKFIFLFFIFIKKYDVISKKISEFKVKSVGESIYKNVTERFFYLTNNIKKEHD